MPQTREPADSVIVWFRNCLRLHDNAALVEAAKTKAKHVYPIFILDPSVCPDQVGVNRCRFLLESLHDLDAQLKQRFQSRLLVLRGPPETIFRQILGPKEQLLGVKPRLLLWEEDTEPFALRRDMAVQRLAEKSGVEVRTFVGRTLYEPSRALAESGGKAPHNMPGMVKLAKALGEPPQPLPLPAKLSPPPRDILAKVNQAFGLPKPSDLGYEAPDAKSPFPGGETAGLARLASMLGSSAYICGFEKPKTRSTAFAPPSTTVLSPYIMFGCVSVRRFYHGVQKVCKGKKHSEPPGSLLGQLYFREMSYLQGLTIPNFDKQAGNPACKPIPWSKSAKLLRAWEQGRTGYPFIDAAMRQLTRDGWLHHLARHAVACFLTRGDLWVPWEQGRDVFDKYLLDADWAINNMNWLALSGAAPWSAPFFRVYHPVPKMDSALNVQDPEGAYIREFVPELRAMPSAFIYAPWTAPLKVQKEAGCIVGKDYPKPIVDHEKASKENIARFKRALSGARATSAGPATKRPRV